MNDSGRGHHTQVMWAWPAASRDRAGFTSDHDHRFTTNAAWFILRTYLTHKQLN